MSAAAQPNFDAAPIAPSQYTPGKATIISIWPFDQSYVTQHAGAITYLHPAAKKDEVRHIYINPERVSNRFIMTENPWLWDGKLKKVPLGQGYTRIDVCDTYTLIRNAAVEDERNPRVLEERRIPARQAADAAVRIFSSNRPGDNIYGGPGMDVWDPNQRSLPDLLAELHNRQTLFARGAVEMADAMYAEEKSTRNITTFHRTLAQWLNINDRPWYLPLTDSPMKTCLNCTKTIPMGALSCPYCQEDLVDFYFMYEMDGGDPRVREFGELRRRIEERKAAMLMTQANKKNPAIPLPEKG